MFSSYREPWDQVADVILPMPTTFEKNGTTHVCRWMRGPGRRRLSTHTRPILEAATRACSSEAIK